ncbi:MAG: hypothetical protein ACQEQO_03265, partial [Thermodesulfobacteriota bacterium]
MGFFEVTGGFRLDSVLEGTLSRKVEPPARREGCCLFVTYQWGNPQPRACEGNAEGFRLGEPPARRGQNSPMDTLLKRPTR